MDSHLTYIRTSNKFKYLSEKYHKLSLLFYELSQSIKLEGKKKSEKEFKQYMKTLNLDLKKIMNLSQDIKNLEIEDLQYEKTIK